MPLNLPDITPAPELVTLSQQTPTQRGKDGTEQRLSGLIAGQKSAVESTLKGILVEFAEEMSETGKQVGWDGKNFTSLGAAVDEIDDRAGLDDAEALKSWELADRMIMAEEILKAQIGRLWNRAETYYSRASALLSAIEAWIRRASHFEKEYEVASEAAYLLYRERLLLAQADEYRRRCQRTYQRIEGTIITLQTLAGRRFNATRYMMDLPPTTTSGLQDANSEQ